MNFNNEDENIILYSIFEHICIYRAFFLGLLHNNYQLLLDNNIMNIKDMYQFIINKVLPESYSPKYQWWGLIKNPNKEGQKKIIIMKKNGKNI